MASGRTRRSPPVPGPPEDPPGLFTQPRPSPLDDCADQSAWLNHNDEPDTRPSERRRPANPKRRDITTASAAQDPSNCPSPTAGSRRPSCAQLPAAQPVRTRPMPGPQVDGAKTFPGAARGPRRPRQRGPSAQVRCPASGRPRPHLWRPRRAGGLWLHPWRQCHCLLSVADAATDTGDILGGQRDGDEVAGTGPCRQLIPPGFSPAASRGKKRWSGRTGPRKRGSEPVPPLENHVQTGTDNPHQADGEGVTEAPTQLRHVLEVHAVDGSHECGSKQNGRP